MGTIKIQFILGSTRQERKGEVVFEWIKNTVGHPDSFEPEFIDLRDWDLPFYNEVDGPLMLKGNYKNEKAKEWAKKIGEADGYVICTPEYDHGYPAVLKNAIDYIYYEWNRKPVGFISWGGISGGIRAVEQLRLVAIELQMAPAREAVHIPFVWSAFDKEGDIIDKSKGVDIKKMLDDLLWWTKALKEARETAK